MGCSNGVAGVAEVNTTLPKAAVKLPVPSSRTSSGGSSSLEKKPSTETTSDHPKAPDWRTHELYIRKLNATLRHMHNHPDSLKDAVLAARHHLDAMTLAAETIPAPPEEASRQVLHRDMTSLDRQVGLVSL
mmetsp:Transcript_15546/g.35606  ORF Transcript_15546/g.35606 Transcript_15546/m.35606 type:complete len:131 (+) Transcript_15546:91-483(+)